MPSTPKYPRSPSPLLPSRICDASVAPYLTHVVTHHATLLNIKGQVTLVPPQTQGRVRTNKKTRKVKESQVQQTQENIQALPVRAVSPLSSTNTPPKKAKRPRRNATQDATNAEDQGPSQSRSVSETSLSHLPPPPSYESIRSDISRTSSTDVIPLPSSSSSTDGFEDFTEMDLETQWELDRMAGFTLEERVRREWHRRQAAVDRTPPTADVGSSTKSPRLIRQASLPTEAITEPSGPPPPPAKHFSDESRETPGSLPASTSGVRQTNSSPTFAVSKRSSDYGPAPTHRKTIQSNALGNKANSSKSSLEDWDVLDPVPPSSSHLSPSYSPKRQSLTQSPGSVAAAILQAEHSEFTHPQSDPWSMVASSSAAVKSPARRSWGETMNSQPPNPSRSVSEQLLTQPRSVTATGPPFGLDASNAGELVLRTRASYKGKERETEDTGTICQPDSNGSSLSAIHRRPLPTPPTLLDPAHSATDPTVTSSPPSASALPRPNSNGTPREERRLTTPPCPPIPGSARPASSNASTSIRDRISKFESMRDRPVPPPPADFLSKTRVKRKPPPLPPSSYRHGISEPGQRDFEFELRPQSIGVSSEPPDRSDNPSASSPFQSPNPVFRPQETLRSPSRGGRDALQPPSSTARSEFGEQSFSTSGQSPRPRPSSSPESLSSILALSDGVSHEPPPAEDLPRNSRVPENSRGSGDRTEDIETVAELIFQGAVVPELPAAARAGTLIPAESMPVEATSSPLAANPPRPDTLLSPYTDLDVLLSRLDDASSGNRYDDLLVVSDILGPAQPQSTPSEIIGDLPVGKIEVMRRRKLQDGRVKLKLSLLGVVVDRCGVCLTQFKDAEWAVLLPCLHPFHSTCLRSWLARSHTCPLCRVALDVPTI